MKNANSKKGFSLVELLVSVAIFALISIAVGTFAKDIFSLNFLMQGNLNAQLDMRHILKVMVTEMREAGPSAMGAYPISLASSTAVTFFSDVDNDGIRDQVRYFLDGKTLKRGVTAPSGTNLVYNMANEKITSLVSNVISSSTLPIFQYYSANYTGTTSPLSFPVDVPSIRLIKITVIINKDPRHSTGYILTSSQVNLRNLKDNL